MTKHWWQNIRCIIADHNFMEEERVVRDGSIIILYKCSYCPARAEKKTTMNTILQNPMPKQEIIKVVDEAKLPSDTEISIACDKQYPKYSTPAKRTAWSLGAKWMRHKAVKALSSKSGHDDEDLKNIVKIVYNITKIAQPNFENTQSYKEWESFVVTEYKRNRGVK